MPAPAPAAVVSDTTAQEQSLPEATSAGDSKVDGRGGTPTTEAEPAVSGALKMIEGSKIPLLVFVNSRSGGQQGKPLLAQFSSWLRPEQVSPSGSSLRSRLAASKPAPEPQPAPPPPAQVIDLATTKPEDALRRFASVEGLRVLVCGGGAACSKCPSLPEPAQPPTSLEAEPFARGCPLPPGGAPSPRGCRGEAAAALWCPPRVAQPTARRAHRPPAIQATAPAAG